MKYKLYNTVNENFSPTSQILYNRGIPLAAQESWLVAGWESINSWGKIDGLESAVKKVESCIEQNKKIQLIIDPDCDGYTSSAIITNYLYFIHPDYNNLHFIFHEGKQHGFADIMNEIDDDTSLIISPDGGTNDIEQHKILADKGIECLILDHHEVSIDTCASPALIVNIQEGDYPNKALTGAGVCWQFCRAYDAIYGYTHANDLIDLCALGNCGDMALLTQHEIRALMNIGLKNIKNPFFEKMVEKNEYQIHKKNGRNYLSIAFYVVPYINAIVRSGKMDEKILVYNALLEKNREVMVASTNSRTKKRIPFVPLVTEAILVAFRVKQRQTEIQNEMLALFERKIEDENLLDNAIILLLCEPDEVDKNVCGLIANKIQAKYQKPCAILTKSPDGASYAGSMRNYSLSEIDNLKEELEKTGEIIFCAGHTNAAGLGIEADKIDSFLKKFNYQYKDVDQEPCYWVDYIWNETTVNKNNAFEIAGLTIYGQGLPESLVALQDICLSPGMVTLLSPNANPTLKINVGGIDVIKFKSSQEEYENFCADNRVVSMICSFNLNEYNGKVTPQLICEDFDLREEWIF